MLVVSEEKSQNNDPSQQVRLNNVTARVPESIRRGVFSTGAIVMSGPNELLIDFIQRMGRPHHVAARVVLPLAAMPQVIDAIERNLNEHELKFGKVKELPKPDQGTPRPNIQEVYDNLKLPDEMLSGTYANAVLIGFTGAEFSFDFVTHFFPHAAVCNRVFLAASHVVQLLDSLKSNLKQVQQRIAKQQPTLLAPPPAEQPKTSPDADEPLV